ncbi:hypothetical protein [Pseudodesulfovibrio sp.]|uniref:hypothetical protein n=1 Tax=unclassified Pseudodesulfovibrio TaxID=2661612 RepID=UPI003AFFCB82
MTKQYPTPPKTAAIGGAILGAATFGAILGATTATAKGIRQVKNGQATKEDVARDAAREAGSTAIAAGTGVAVVSALSLGPLLSTVGVAAVAVGIKYALDSVLKPAPVKAVAGGVTTTPAKPAAKKPTAKKTATGKATAKKAARKTTTKEKVSSKASEPETAEKA